jgi:Cyclin D1 binding domain
VSLKETPQQHPKSIPTPNTTTNTPTATTTTVSFVHILFEESTTFEHYICSDIVVAPIVIVMFHKRSGSGLLLASCITTLFTPNHDWIVGVNGFTSAPLSRSVGSSIGSTAAASVRSTSPLHMAIISPGDDFFDDFRERSGDDSNHHQYYISRHVQQQDENKHKFVTGDELHRLRHQVLALRLELQEARRNLQQFADQRDSKQGEDNEDDIEYRHTRHYQQQRVHELEQAIMKTQQVDAEFVYTVSLERRELAEQAGNLLEASRHHQTAMEARAALPQFNLEGLWVGKYSEDGYEMINVTYQGDVLLAEKVTGTKNVPKGQATFQVDLSPRGGVVGMLGARNEQQQQVLSPIELGDSAANQWGCRYLPRFAGKGQVAADGYQDSQWIDGQLIMVNEYFSFAWLPIGHQVFFGRPTPELILKLMKDEKKKEGGDCSARAFLEKCWEETEHIEDDFEINNDDDNDDLSMMMDSSPADRSYYYEDGCFQ